MRKCLAMDWAAGFQCIGAECPMTCCGGWNLGITKQEIQNYKKLASTSPFGEDLLAAIDEENDCIRQCDQRCVLLTEEGWCKLILECGEEYLSKTCETFPRTAKDFGDILEYLVEIVCPVVAEKLFNEEQIGFLLEEIDEGTEGSAEEIDFELYDMLAMVRAFLVELFQSYDARYNAVKLYILFSAVDEVRNISRGGKLDKTAMQSWLGRWNSASCESVYGVVEPIRQRIDLKAAKLLGLLNKLMSGGVFEVLMSGMGERITEEEYFGWLNDRAGLEQDIRGFTEYFSGRYSGAFENFYVYNLFRNWIPRDLQMKDFGTELRVQAVVWALIQMCAMSVWKRNGGITKEEYALIVCGIERWVTHSSIIAEKLADILEEEESIGNILLYMIC